VGGQSPDVPEPEQRGELRVVDPDEAARARDDALLGSAWRLFGTYDAAAVRYKRHYERLQGWMLGLGVAATFFALLHESAGLDGADGDAVHWLVVALPIAVATLIALAGRLAAGKRWVLLRGAAEGVKREIYRFRTRTGPYAEGARAETLASQLAVLDELVMQTEVSGAVVRAYQGALPPKYGAAKDDPGFSDLTPDDYLRVRLDDQVCFYRGKVPKLGRRRLLAIGVTLGAGGAGTILAAANQEIWVGLTTAVAGAAIAYVAYVQIESTIVAYNQAASRLESLRRRWAARAEASDDAVDALVDDVEGILATEHSGWLQQMNDALEKVEKKEARDRGADRA
jgi:SMODS and SLOG-associating 2TM effector domain 1/Protein of unknown function (DUF4231)